jgi:hypothetical protein
MNISFSYQSLNPLMFKQNFKSKMETVYFLTMDQKSRLGYDSSSMAYPNTAMG